MPSGVGHFDSFGNPCLKFHLCGVAHEEPGLEYEGIIDTGFSGFIQLPFNHAFSLKLPLEGTVTAILADGSKTANLTALARTSFGGKTVTGAVTLAPGSQDILVGMGFLRRFKLGLLMVSNGILLVDEEEIEEIQAQHKTASKQAETPTDREPPTPPPPPPIEPHV